MNISFTFKNFDPSEHLKKYANRRFSKISRFLGKNVEAELSVVMTVDKFRHKIELLLTANGSSTSAVESSEDMYATVDMVLDKLESQVKRQHGRSLEHRKSGSRGKKQPHITQFVTQPGAEGMVLVQDHYVEQKPVFPEEAIQYLTENEQDMVVFLNAETERLNIMYRKENGSVSLIDPEEQFDQ